MFDDSAHTLGLAGQLRGSALPKTHVLKVQRQRLIHINPWT